MICFDDACERDRSMRHVSQSIVVSERPAGPEVDASGSLVNFLILEEARSYSTQGYADPQKETWHHPDSTPTGVFEVGRYRLKKVTGSALNVIIVFSNMDFDPRMAPVIVTQVSTTRSEDVQIVISNVLAVNEKGFLLNVASPYSVTDWNADISFDIMWYAYGFTTPHEDMKIQSSDGASIPMASY